MRYKYLSANANMKYKLVELTTRVDYGDVVNRSQSTSRSSEGKNNRDGTIEEMAEIK